MKSSEDSNSIKSDNDTLENKNLDFEDEGVNKITKNTEDDIYRFGWSKYAEITNGRFAMVGFLSIILIELLSNQSFLKWAGILN